jgi:FixJ family two-component response regulator
MRTVFVVDDDAALRDALVQLLEADGLRVEAYADGPTFLTACGEDCPGCVLLDMAMPGMTGRQVQAALKDRGWNIPILFLTGHGDIPMAVRAVQNGAVDFLEKPVHGAVLLERVHRALTLDRNRREAQAHAHAVRQRHARLSPREQEIMALVVAGRSNKEIARQLGLSHRTVEVHRTHIMDKMGAANLAELVSMAAYCWP